MDRVQPSLRRRSLPNGRSKDDQGRFFLMVDSLAYCSVDLVKVMAVDFECIPPIGTEAHFCVF